MVDEKWNAEVLLPMKRNPNPPTLEEIRAIVPEFDPAYPEGIRNVHLGGTLWGVHPFYDYGPMPRHVGWDLMRERIALLRTVGRMSLCLRAEHHEAITRLYAPHGPNFENVKAMRMSNQWEANSEEQTKHQKLA